MTISDMTRITTNATTTIHTGKCVIHGIFVNDIGTTETISLLDDTTTYIDAVSVPAAGTLWLLDASIKTSLKIITAGSAAADVLILWFAV